MVAHEIFPVYMSCHSSISGHVRRPVHVVYLYHDQTTSVQWHRRQVHPPGELSVESFVGTFQMPKVTHFRRWLREPTRRTAFIIVVTTRGVEPSKANADLWYELFTAARFYFEWYVRNPGKTAPEYVYSG
jgi:hypothetical protein